MYDIKTIAFNLEVTPQTVYNHLKRNKQELKHHIFKSKGVTYIDDAGLIIIKKSMGLIQVPTVAYFFMNLILGILRLKLYVSIGGESRY